MEGFLPLIVLFGALWFLLIRPQQKRARAQRELVRSLAEGDEVVTNAGIHGVIVEVEPTVVWVEVAPDVELKISRDAVTAKTRVDDGADAVSAGTDDGADATSAGTDDSEDTTLELEAAAGEIVDAEIVDEDVVEEKA